MAKFIASVKALQWQDVPVNSGWRMSKDKNQTSEVILGVYYRNVVSFSLVYCAQSQALSYLTRAGHTHLWWVSSSLGQIVVHPPFLKRQSSSNVDKQNQVCRSRQFSEHVLHVIDFHTRKLLAEKLKGPLICHFTLVKPSFQVWHVGFVFIYLGSLFSSNSTPNDRYEPCLIN